jgi:hypothetical protein
VHDAGDIGRGLFAAQLIKKGDFICEWKPGWIPSRLRMVAISSLDRHIQFPRSFKGHQKVFKKPFKELQMPWNGLRPFQGFSKVKSYP